MEKAISPTLHKRRDWTKYTDSFSVALSATTITTDSPTFISPPTGAESCFTTKINRAVPKSKTPKSQNFVDVTRRVGLTLQPWGTSCAWADIDGDGYLDLLICNYVDYDKTKVQLCKQKDVLTACPPQTYKPLFPAIFRNVAGGRFTDATHGFLSAASNGNNLGIALADSEGTGRLDIALANDLRPGDLYRRPSPGNNGAFANIGASSGTATDGTGGLHAGMGVDWGDADRDGKLDLFVTTFSKETKCLYRNLGDGIFEEDSHLAGLATPTWNYVAFGCKFLDADNDGWLDLITTNGHTSDNVHAFSTASYRQPLQFFRNAARRPLAFTDETNTFAAGKPFPAIVGRGLAIGDYDNDGRIDVLIVDAEGSPLLLHNETPNAGNYLTLDLIGAGKSNRDAYGARVTVISETGEKTVVERSPNGSYLSSSDPRLHIGLGAAKKADITLRWPDGRQQTWSALSANKSYRLKEGATNPIP